MVRFSAKTCNCILFLFVWSLLATCFIFFFVNTFKYKPKRFTQHSRNEDFSYRKEELEQLPTNIPFNLPFHDQESPLLLEYVRSKLVPPAPKDQEYFLKLNEYDTSQGQAQIVRQLLNYKRDGFFVECGGGNGEFFSNSLFMEQHLNWTGLLVEADPIHAKELLTVHRKAWFSPFCLSLNTSTYQTYFLRTTVPFWGHVQDDPGKDTVRVTCFPFYTHLLALNVTKVDYFSLDIEGHEVEVLESVPFDKIDIDILSVEFSHTKAGKMGVIDTMGKKGYKVIKEMNEDIIFAKNDLMNDDDI